MVWFQCEDCGENLKKPKLPNHFRICSAYKLSCIDCGETFSQQSVQGHTQCISEAEKYGPKDQAKSARDAQAKVNKPKPALDIDVNVGLSTFPPWTCSLCNTTTTSKQTLLLHADGKKHTAKAKAFYAAQKQASEPEKSAANKDDNNGISTMDASKAKSTKNLDETRGYDAQKDSSCHQVEEENLLKNKRKTGASKYTGPENQVESHNGAEANGEVIQSNDGKERSSKKRKKVADLISQIEDQQDANSHATEVCGQKIRWRKLIISILNSNSDGALKVKKLQKLVIKAIKDSGVTEDKEELKKKLMDKISSSSQFLIDGKHIHLAKMTKSS